MIGWGGAFRHFRVWLIPLSQGRVSQKPQQACLWWTGMKRRTVLILVRVVVLLVLHSCYIPPGFSMPPSGSLLLFCLFFQTPVLRLMKMMKVSSVTLPLSFESQWRGDLTTEVFHWGLKKYIQVHWTGNAACQCIMRPTVIGGLNVHITLALDMLSFFRVPIG